MPRHALKTLTGLSLLLLAAAAMAGELYQWKDASGVTHYSQTPPPSGSYTARTESGRDVTPPPAAAAAGKPAESSQCATARSNIAMLEGQAPVQQDLDGDGKPDRTLDDADRANQLELARALLKANCANDTPASTGAD